MAQQIWVGVGGWNYDAWRGTYYPKGLPRADELSYSSRHLTAIEIDSTFYRNPGPEVFQKWHDETPDHFKFTLKAPRYVMNRKVLAGAGQAIENFVEGGVKNLGAKLGAINWRFDERKPFEPEDFEACLALLPKDVPHAVEARHPSFRCEAFVELARKYGVSIVLAGDSVHPMIPDITGPFAYIRIMGTRQEEPRGYSETDLDTWVERARAYSRGEIPEGFQPVSSKPVSSDPRNVFLYFINGFKQSNPAAAMAIVQRLRS